MNPLFLVILLVIIILIIYWLANNNNNITNNSDYFTILKKIQGQIAPTNNPKINNIMIDSNENNVKFPAKKFSQNYENFTSDSFITVGGNQVRKELVPSNYANDVYANANGNFILDQYGLKENTPTKKFAPQAWNIYLD